MEDKRVVELFWQRSPHAVDEAQKAYGRPMTALALRVLGDARDAEECVNDALLRVWNTALNLCVKWTVYAGITTALPPVPPVPLQVCSASPTKSSSLPAAMIKRFPLNRWLPKSLSM